VNLFQETLKAVASRHKCGDTILKKPVFCRFSANFFFSKTGNYQQNIPFSDNCVAIWRFFAKKEITGFSALLVPKLFLYSKIHLNPPPCFWQHSQLAID
jgi:hypothetical protein